LKKYQSTIFLLIYTHPQSKNERTLTLAGDSHSGRRKRFGQPKSLAGFLLPIFFFHNNLFLIMIESYQPPFPKPQTTKTITVDGSKLEKLEEEKKRREIVDRVFGEYRGTLDGKRRPEDEYLKLWTAYEVKMARSLLETMCTFVINKECAKTKEQALIWLSDHGFIPDDLVMKIDHYEKERLEMIDNLKESIALLEGEKKRRRRRYNNNNNSSKGVKMQRKKEALNSLKEELKTIRATIPSAAEKAKTKTKTKAK